MPKVKISEYSATANSNTDVASINIDEGCAPSGINNAIRAVMGHLKDFQQGTYGDPFNGPVNGTLGATTASTANVTTLTTSSTVTHNGGTANGVAYLNGSKVLTTGSALVFDGSNLGVGVTPSATTNWANLFVNYALLQGRSSDGSAVFSANTTGPGNYATSNAASYYYQTAGQHRWYNAASGTAGNAITFTQAMTLDASGNLLVGVTSANANGGVLQLKSGITFPATAVAATDANTLDDYEEGTFTPAVSSGSGGPVVLSTALGQYTKIGNIVNFRLRITVSNANSAGGAIDITGLPFTASSTIANRTRVVSADISNVTGSTTDSIGGSFVPTTATRIAVLTSTAGNVTLTNTSSMDFNGTYFAA